MKDIKTKIITLVILFLVAFTTKSFGQLPITYYSFESGSTYSTFVQTPYTTINTASVSTFGRNSGSTVNNTNSIGISIYHGLRSGKAINSVDWSTASSDPGTSASKYYQIKVNTSNFNGIGLNFDIWTNSIAGVNKFGILYSTNGSTFNTLGTTDMSGYPGYVFQMNLDFSSITALNNQSEVTFRIYGYNASNTTTSYLNIDNFMVTALSSVNGTSALLNEPNIFSSYAGGLTGYVWIRNGFTVGTSSTINLNSALVIRNNFTVNGTLVCGTVANYIMGPSTDTSSTFTLNPNATIKIGDPDGISTTGYTGHINTLNRIFSTQGNYIYSTSGTDNSHNNHINTDESNAVYVETETPTNIALNNNNVQTKVNVKQTKDVVTPITGNALPSTINSLTVNNTGNLNLTSSVSITNYLTLTNGILTIGTNNVTLGAAGTVNGTPGNTNMVAVDGTGEFRKVYNSIGSFTFPIGDAAGNGYSPVTLNFTSGTFSNNAIGISILNGKNPNNLSVNDYLTRSWIVTNYGVTNFLYNISMNYIPSDVHGTESNIFFGKLDAGTWTLLGQTNPVTHIMSGNGINQFSTFTGGEQGSMPVELTSFVSSVNGRDVKLNWATASEENNKGFEVQKSSTNGQWSTITFVNGRGNSSTQTIYNFTDSKLNSGKYNYRLKQIDNNGNYKFYNLNNTIEIGLPSKYNLSQNYPNPFNPTTKIDYDLPVASKVNLKVYDITGREVTSLVNTQQSVGNYTVQLNASNFASGIYFYSLTASAEGKQVVITKKMNIIK